MKKAELLNLLLVAAIAVPLSLWSYVSYSRAEVSQKEVIELLPKIQFEQDISVSQNALIRLNGRDSIELLAGTSAKISYEQAESHFKIYLKEGAVIVATEAGDFDAEIISGYATVNSAGGTVYASLSQKDGNFQVYALNHPSLLTFTKNEKNLNSMYIPTHYRVNVLASKVNETIAKLRLTKLSKEFQIFEFKEIELPAAVSKELSVMQKAYTNAELAFLSQIQKEGDLGPATTGFGARLDIAYGTARNFLTFASFAKENLAKAENSNYLKYSLANAVKGESAISKIWLDKWRSGTTTAIPDLKELNASLFFVLPGDNLYFVKKAISVKSSSQKLNEIESLLSQASNVEASLAFKDAIKDGTFTESKDMNELSRQYIILELLLRTNSIFYNVDSEALLKKMEEGILSLAGTGQDLDEERQAFVQSKIRFLTNLFAFVQDSKISVETATVLANKLLSDARDYLNSISAKVAVGEYYKQVLNGFEISIQFINSPEYKSFSSFDEGLTAFKLKIQDLEDLNSYLQNIRSSNSKNGDAGISPAAATQNVMNDLSENGIQYYGVNSLGDSENRLFQISGGRIAGYAFTGNYDRETKILYDVNVGDVKFGTGLALGKFRDVVKNAMANDATHSVIDENEESVYARGESSLTGDVAISYAARQFESAGFDASGLQIEIVDIEKNLFSFSGSLTESDISVSGTYDANSNKVSEIVWYMDGKSQTLPDMNLDSLAAALTATYSAMNSPEI